MIVSGNFWMEQIRPCGPFIGRQPTRSAGTRIEIEHRARADSLAATMESVIWFVMFS